MKLTFQKIIRLEPLMHVIFWCLVLLYPYIENLGREGGYSMGLIHELVGLVFNMIPVYVMYFWFFSLKNKKKIAPFIVVFFIALAYIEFYFDGFFHSGDYHNYWAGILTNVISYTSLTILFFAVYSLKQLYQKQQELDIAAVKNQEAELRVLKGQINPHFLFNTLNTIYASALEKDNKTPDLILKLSDSFRYILTEGQKNNVPLKKEITHIKDYINLQEERLSNKILVDWSEDIDDYEQKIPPLLFISLVENAFKYSSMLTGEGHLIILKTRLKDGKLTFYVENSFKENSGNELDTDWKESGIGLENTKKRLQLLFSDRYKMEINKKDETFKVSLTIQL
ncbi:sensor histidine kinase [Aquimarina sp. RZ0]|uniref:sensor histidine kinase n=1 Tax=Aquimarina sp. RZ0 TaxID=2607730 RepID=UPI0011F2FB1E|nr:histidine kinase [Aquimarina sp. RZ0]KAA1248015.1 GHKL domain-containing protein [Aquimarina sp. RZ0]